MNSVLFYTAATLAVGTFYCISRQVIKLLAFAIRAATCVEKRMNEEDRKTKRRQRERHARYAKHRKTCEAAHNKPCSVYTEDGECPIPNVCGYPIIKNDSRFWERQCPMDDEFLVKPTRVESAPTPADRIANMNRRGAICIPDALVSIPETKEVEVEDEIIEDEKEEGTFTVNTNGLDWSKYARYNQITGGVQY